MSKKKQVRALVDLFDNEGALIVAASKTVEQSRFPAASVPELIEAGLVEEVK